MENTKSQITLSILYCFGALGVFASISSQVLRLIFLVGAVGFFLFYILQVRKKTDYASDIFVLATVFFLFVSLWSVNFHFTPAWWIFLLFSAAILFLLAWAVSYTILEQEKTLVYSVFSTLILLETFWVLLFWPTHFVTLAIVSFSVFYLLYVLTGLYYEHKLDRNKIIFQAGIILVILILTLISSPWGVA